MKSVENQGIYLSGPHGSARSAAKARILLPTKGVLTTRTRLRTAMMRADVRPRLDIDLSGVKPVNSSQKAAAHMDCRVDRDSSGGHD